MVANVRSDDVLNIRSGPLGRLRGRRRAAARHHGIAITSDCRAQLVPGAAPRASGWVNSIYLVAPRSPAAAALHDRPARWPDSVRLRRSANSPDAPRGCLKPAAHALLDRIEQKFGPVSVISTCRPAPSSPAPGRPSRHASGNAVDFDAGARKAAILEWLIANHRSGGIMTYAGMDHIHVDIGPRFISIAGGRHWSSWNSRREGSQATSAQR